SPQRGLVAGEGGAWNLSDSRSAEPVARGQLHGQRGFGTTGERGCLFFRAGAHGVWEADHRASFALPAVRLSSAGAARGFGAGLGSCASARRGVAGEAAVLGTLSFVPVGRSPGEILD